MSLTGRVSLLLSPLSGKVLYLFHMSSISGLKFSYESRIKKMLPTIIKTPVFSNDGTGQSERAVRSGPANGVDSERTHAHA